MTTAPIQRRQHHAVPVGHLVTITATDPATGRTMRAELEHAGQPVTLDVLVAGLLRTGLRCHGLRCRDVRQVQAVPPVGPAASQAPARGETSPARAFDCWGER